MNLSHMLSARRQSDRPVKTGLIGCGKFATMFAAQVPHTPGLELTIIADLMPDRASANLRGAGWDETGLAGTVLTRHASDVIEHKDVEVVIEATGDPIAGADHALAAIDAGKHVVMVNVEADVLCGPVLAARARERGVVYTMAYGDQPALIAELVDWARTCGFDVVAAGKGTKYQPHYHASTPDTVWTHYGITPGHAKASGMNPKMFNSFLDGTKSAIEMAAVANGCGLDVPEDGLKFPPCGVDDLQHILRPKDMGGLLPKEGMVEVVSSIERDDRPVYRDLRWGVYVVIKAPTAYAQRCFADYGLKTDSSGLYASLYRPYHMIGLELGVSVANAALRGEPTGQSRTWRGDVVAVVKSDLRQGSELDGEGGHCVYGKLVPAGLSQSEDLLPIGLAQHVKLRRGVQAGQTLTFGDVTAHETSAALTLRRQMAQM